MMDCYNKSLDVQIKTLEEIIYKNSKLIKLLKILENSGLNNYYVAAGCINQTVFNYYHGYNLDYGIKDYDVVYYDNDISYEKEDLIIKKINSLIDIDIVCDIKNEARVYLWYSNKYGKDIEQYSSVEDAISCWGTSVTCIGVRLENSKLKIYAPYGLNDLFGMIIRPIKKQFTEDGYIKKSKSWLSKWPKLKVLPWDDEIE